MQVPLLCNSFSVFVLGLKFAALQTPDQGMPFWSPLCLMDNHQKVLLMVGWMVQQGCRLYLLQPGFIAGLFLMYVLYAEVMARDAYKSLRTVFCFLCLLDCCESVEG